MSVHAQYLVKCVGGGWLCPGRPLACLGVPTRYSSAVKAFTSAKQAGWSYDVVTQEHRCPAHQSGDGHMHQFVSPPSGAELPKRPVIQTCPCGEQRERPW